MDWELITRWNSVVGPDDIIWHLGDFCFGKLHQVEWYLNRLNGKIHMLKNIYHHDRYWMCNALNKKKKLFSKSGHLVTFREPVISIRHEKQIIVLCHFPFASWDRRHYGSWHLFGHCHGNFQVPEGEKMLDVGVDSWDFTPVSFEQIKERMDNVKRCAE